MNREMVEVVLYENGTYEVNDIDSDYATQRLFGFRHDMWCDIYRCPKSNWKKRLLKLLSTNRIDKKIKELEKQKRKIEKLKEKITKELESEE